MNKIDINERRQEQERGVSVKGLLKDILAEADDLESVVIIARNREKEILVGFSTDNTMETLGFLEVAKNEILYN